MPGRYKNKGSSKLARAALKMAKRNRRNIGGESKAKDIEVCTTDVTNVATAGFVTLLSDIDQGDERFDRDGNEVKALSLHIRGKVEWQLNGENSAVTIIVLKKLINNDDPPTKHGILGVETAVLITGAVDACIPIAPLLWENRMSWKILSRDTFVGNPDSQDNLVFNKYYRLNHKVYFDNATGSSGAKQGNIYFVAISEQDAGITAPHLSFHSRFRYTD